MEPYRRIQSLAAHRHGVSPHHRLLPGSRDRLPRVGEECKQQALAWFARLDARLAEVPYMAGDRFTIADILALCTIDFGKVVGLRIAPHQYHLQAWHERVSARPSAQA
ncbi:glutathione binding-like protein [Aeromonas rivipollensis]|uniref:glutathione binding-like protein n=1 Tax=Aeromonas rivipollensis TaxID=948519 RepID=UPI003D1CCAB2